MCIPLFEKNVKLLLIRNKEWRQPNIGQTSNDARIITLKLNPSRGTVLLAPHGKGNKCESTRNIDVCETLMPPFPNMTFDLDLWPTDLKNNRDHLLIKDYLPSKFEAFGAKPSWVISCTRLRDTDIPTYRPTCATQYAPPFSKGGIIRQLIRYRAAATLRRPQIKLLIHSLKICVLCVSLTILDIYFLTLAAMQAPAIL